MGPGAGPAHSHDGLGVLQHAGLRSKRGDWARAVQRAGPPVGKRHSVGPGKDTRGRAQTASRLRGASAQVTLAVSLSSTQVDPEDSTPLCRADVHATGCPGRHGTYRYRDTPRNAPENKEPAPKVGARRLGTSRDPEFVHGLSAGLRLGTRTSDAAPRPLGGKRTDTLTLSCAA